MYVPTAVIWHREHYVTDKNQGNGFIEFHLARANMIFARKHVPLKAMAFQNALFLRLDGLPHSGVLIPPGLAKSRVLI